jgi:hypothetical protein
VALLELVLQGALYALMKSAVREIPAQQGHSFPHPPKANRLELLAPLFRLKIMSLKMLPQILPISVGHARPNPLRPMIPKICFVDASTFLLMTFS